MRYHVNESCIGCGLCASICPGVFSMAENGSAVAAPGEVPGEESAAAAQAMNSCPVNAIEEAY